jgi:uncharacterized protein (TIGR00297 family)
LLDVGSSHDQLIAAILLNDFFFSATLPQMQMQWKGVFRIKLCLHSIWVHNHGPAAHQQVSHTNGPAVLQASVLGSGSAGMVCALAAMATGNVSMFQAGFVASFGSKLSDTVSSEIGKGFGKTTYLITSLQRVPPGTEGAVSAEGTAAGVAAALVYATIACLVGQVDALGALICVVAATIANVAESYIGATSQNSVRWLSNDGVNVIQIFIAAAIAVLLQACLGRPL